MAMQEASVMCNETFSIIPTKGPLDLGTDKCPSGSRGSLLASAASRRGAPVLQLSNSVSGYAQLPKEEWQKQISCEDGNTKSPAGLKLFPYITPQFDLFVEECKRKMPYLPQGKPAIMGTDVNTPSAIAKTCDRVMDIMKDMADKQELCNWSEKSPDVDPNKRSSQSPTGQKPGRSPPRNPYKKSGWLPNSNPYQKAGWSAVLEYCKKPGNSPADFSKKSKRPAKVRFL